MINPFIRKKKKNIDALCQIRRKKVHIILAARIMMPILIQKISPVEFIIRANFSLYSIIDIHISKGDRKVTPGIFTFLCFPTATQYIFHFVYNHLFNGFPGWP